MLEPRLVLAAPTLDAIRDVMVPAGQTLLIALNGHDTDNDALSFTASAGTGSGLTPTVMPSSNPSLRITAHVNANGTVQTSGVMELQLLQNYAPNTVARIIQLVNAGFYNTGTAFIGFDAMRAPSLASLDGKTFQVKDGTGASATFEFVDQKVDSQAAAGNKPVLFNSNTAVLGTIYTAMGTAINGAGLQCGTNPYWDVAGDSGNTAYWNLTGATLSNTDNGKLYWSITNASDTATVKVFKDSAGQNLVASGSASVASSYANITLTAQNGSGLSGTMSVAKQVPTIAVSASNTLTCPESLAVDGDGVVLSAGTTPFIASMIFHRIIPGFMAQGGDQSGTGSGQSGIAGWAVAGDTAKATSNWTFSGNTVINTNNGKLYWSMTNANGTATVNVYKDSAGQNLVASGSGSVAAGPATITLTARNASGLSGSVTLKQNAAAVSVAADRVVTSAYHMAWGVAGDTNSATSNWGFDGASYNNTDNGKLYWSIDNANDTVTVNVYKDSAGQNLVASGSANVANGPAQVALTARNSSGLSGTVILAQHAAKITQGASHTVSYERTYYGIPLETASGLQYTSSGILAMARLSDPYSDSNDAQFFITDGPYATLNSQYTPFGFLTKGDSLRAAISNVGTTADGNKVTDSNDKPLVGYERVIDSMQIFQDTQNGVLLLKTDATATGDYAVTVTVSDGHGGTAQQVFRVHTHLQPVSAVQTTIGGGPVNVAVPAFTTTTGTYTYTATTSDSLRLVASSPQLADGAVTTVLTPSSDLIGSQWVEIQASKDGTVVDTLRVQVNIAPAAPTAVAMTGSATSSLTNANNTATRLLHFTVATVMEGAEVTLKDEQGRVLFSGSNYTRNGASAEITTNGQVTLSDGSHTITATQTYQGATSAATAGLQITVDTVAPVITSTAGAYVRLNDTYNYTVTVQPVAGETYAFSVLNPPANMSIGAATGVLTWSPATPAGDQQVQVRATDPAGNTTTQSFVVHVLGGSSGPIIDLSTFSGAGAILRRAGSEIQVVNDRTGQVTLHQALATTYAMTFMGVAGQANQVTIDLKYGGNFNLIAGIAFDGGGGAGTDTLVVRGTTGADTLEVNGTTVTANGLQITPTGLEQIRLEGNAGSNTYRLTASSTPVAVVATGASNTLDFSGATAGVTVSLALSSGQTQQIAPWQTTLAITGTVQNLIGTNFADALTGNTAGNVIRGGGGADVIHGGGGRDALLGGDGNDTLYSDSGSSLLIGGLGADTLNGGRGADLLVGGTTNYDNNDQALLSVVSQLSSARAMLSSASNRLRSSIGCLAQMKMQDDGVRNALYGGGGQDWFMPGRYDTRR